VRESISEENDVTTPSPNISAVIQDNHRNLKLKEVFLNVFS
jgi:hypothetical protein